MPVLGTKLHVPATVLALDDYHVIDAPDVHEAVTFLLDHLPPQVSITAEEREMLLGWRDLVEGLFELRRKDGDSVILLNLLDDLEYRTYSNRGRAVFRPLPKGGFVYARLVPIRPVPGAWMFSGTMTTYPKAYTALVTQTALDLSVRQPELVFRNPEKVEQGWRRMREDRAEFVAFFGGDELVLPPAEAEERISERHFTWAEHGETLLRRRKAWYYEREPRPGFSVLGARLSELAALARQK